MERIKKIMLSLLSFSMVLGYSMPVLANEEQQPVAQEISTEDSIDFYAADITKPVIELVDMDKKGQTVDSGTSVKVIVHAYDDVAIDYVEVGFNSWDAEGSVLEPDSIRLAHIMDNIYEANYEIPQGRLVKLSLTEVRVVDTSGNVANKYIQENISVNVNSTQKPEVGFTGSVTDIQFDGKNQVIVDNDFKELRITLDDKNEEVSHLIAYFKDEVGNESSITLYKGNQKSYFSATINYNEFKKMGKFTLSRLEGNLVETYQYIDLNIDKFEKFSFTIQCSDQVGPRIEEIIMPKKGQILKQGDTLDIKVKVCDDSKLDEFGYIIFRSVVPGVAVENSEFTVNLHYNPSSGYYEGNNVLTDKQYPSEWMISYGHFMDEFGNSSNLDSYLDTHNRNDYYFNFMKDDTITNPTYDKIMLLIYEYGKDNTLKQTNCQEALNVVHRMTYKDAGFKLPTTSESPVPGLKFVGWQDDEGNLVDENSPIAPFASSSVGGTHCINLKPRFDKRILNLHLQYLNSNNQVAEYYRLLAVDNNMTYTKLTNQLNNGLIPLEDLNRGYDYKGWESEYRNSDETDLILHNHVSFKAVYPNKSIVSTTYNYLGKDGNFAYVIDTEVVDRNTISYEEHAKKAVKRSAPNQYDGLRFKGWTDVDLSLHPSGLINQPYVNFNTHAINENCYLQIILDYDFKGSTGIGLTPESVFDYIYVEVHEKGDKVTLPTTLNGYQKLSFITSNQYPPVPVNPGQTITLNKDFTIYGYGENKAESEKPMQPEKPTEPEKPAGSTTLTPDQVTEIIEIVNNSKDQDVVNVQMGDATVVPHEVLEVIKGKDVTLVLNMNGYQWTINGKEVLSENLKDINLEVTLDTNNIPEKVINNLAKGRPVRQLSLTYEGDFGFRGWLNFYMGKEYAGQKGSLYYYNSDGRMVLMDAGMINTDGYVSVCFTHASDYAFVVETSKNETQPVKPNDKEDNTNKKEDSKKTESAQTRLETHGTFMLLMMVASLVLFVALKNKEVRN